MASLDTPLQHSQLNSVCQAMITSLQLLCPGKPISKYLLCISLFSSLHLQLFLFSFNYRHNIVSNVSMWVGAWVRKVYFRLTHLTHWNNMVAMNEEQNIRVVTTAASSNNLRKKNRGSHNILDSTTQLLLLVVWTMLDINKVEVCL